MLIHQHRGRAGSPAQVTVAPTLSEPPDERTRLRSQALDALVEAVLIVDDQGRVTDCNAQALSLFSRHRAALEGQFVNALRRFEGTDEGAVRTAAAARGVWIGEAWARQPDGAVRLCRVRVIAVRDGKAVPEAYVEAFLELPSEGQGGRELHDLVYGVRALDSAFGLSDDLLRSIAQDLRVLSEAFRDLDLLVRHYEQLLPVLAAHDPLTESIAGQVSETRALAAAVGAPALLEEIPRTLTRLREALRVLGGRLAPPTAP